jgi:hypothetical protein
MATRKNQQISSLCGGFVPADEVQRLRTDGRYDNDGVARAMGVPLQTYLNAVAATDPVPERPLNWTSVNAPCPSTIPVAGVNYYGIAAQAYSHP